MTKYLFAKLAVVCAAMIMCCQCFTTEELFGFDYCSTSSQFCNKQLHIFCVFDNFNVSPTCLRDMSLTVHKGMFLTPDDQVKIVKLHNNLRALVTKGMVPNQPPALNMKIMRWDDELAMMAKVRLVKCREVVKFGNKLCYTTRYNERVGSNLIKELLYPAPFVNGYASIIEAWFDQYKEVPPGVVYKYDGILDDIGQIAYIGYSQIAWADSFKVGCERMTGSGTFDERYFNETFNRRNANITTEVLFCLYAPRGNVFGEPIYEAGPELEWEVDTEEDDVPASARDIVPGPLFLQVVAISLVRLISA